MEWEYLYTLRIGEFIDGLKIVCRFEDFEQIGNELYGLSRTDDGRRFIVICLLEYQECRWAFKLFDETMNPDCFNCPQRLLDQSDIPDNSHWRERCMGFRMPEPELMCS